MKSLFRVSGVGFRVHQAALQAIDQLGARLIDLCYRWGRISAVVKPHRGGGSKITGNYLRETIQIDENYLGLNGIDQESIQI